MAANDGKHPVPFVMPGIPYSNSTGLGGSPGAQSPPEGEAWDSGSAGVSLGVTRISADPYASGQNPNLPTVDVHAGDVNVPGQFPDALPFTGQDEGGSGNPMTAGQAGSSPFGTGHIVPVPNPDAAASGHPNSAGAGRL
jgi:hypothetical protein